MPFIETSLGTINLDIENYNSANLSWLDPVFNLPYKEEIYIVNYNNWDWVKIYSPEGAFKGEYKVIWEE